MARVERRRHVAAESWSYASLAARQQEVRDEVLHGGRGAILISEVAPVVTLGRRACIEDELHVAPSALEKAGIEILRTDRGGLATYHGPGQWVLFAVDRLDRLTGDRHGVRKAVEGLLAVARDAARPWEPRAEIRIGDQAGVWGPRGKIASVGVKIDRGILLHGLCVNGFRTPESFFGIRPCGLEAPVQFLLDRPDPEEFLRLGDLLVQAAQERFYDGEIDPVD